MTTNRITCPYCGETFDRAYYERYHVPCPDPRGDKAIEARNPTWAAGRALALADRHDFND